MVKKSYARDTVSTNIINHTESLQVS